MNILALDLASTSGHCSGVIGSTPRAGVERFGGADDSHQDRWHKAFRFVFDRLAFQTDAVFIEAPADPNQFDGPRAPGVALLLIGMVAVACEAARLRNVPVHLETVQTVRKFFLGGRGFIVGGKPVVGRGNMPGKIAKQCVIARCAELGLGTLNNNAADAAALWYFGAAKLLPGQAWALTPLREAAA